MNKDEYNFGLGRCHLYFLLQDKDIDLTNYINVTLISADNECGLWYDTKVDDELYTHLHLVNYGTDIYHEDICDSDFLSFYLDEDKYDIPANTDEELNEEFDKFVVENDFAYPIENILDGWWKSKYELFNAVQTFIKQTAQQKAFYYLRDKGE